MTADTAPEHSDAVGLPTYFTRFIGRDRELSPLRARLLMAAETTSPQARLTTLVGSAVREKPGWLSSSERG